MKDVVNRSMALAGAILVTLAVAGLGVILEEPSGKGSADRARSTSRPAPSPAARAPRPKPATSGSAAPVQVPSPAPPGAAQPEGALEVVVLVGNTPVPGAQVRLYRREEVDARRPGRWSDLGAGETEGGGQRVLPVPPGTYFVTARMRDLAPAHAAVVHPPGPARTSVHLRLEPAVELVGFTAVRETSEPLAFAEVLLVPAVLPPDLQGRVEAPAEAFLSTTSGETGEFRFTGLAPGKYRAELRAPGHVPHVLPSVPVPFGARLTVGLSRGGLMKGRVVDEEGRPVPGAEVLASGRARAPAVLTDERGAFTLELLPGEYTVSAWRGQQAGALGERVRLTEDQPVGGLRIPLGAGARLDGRVTRADGSPVLGARVELRPRGTRGISGLAGTNAEGAFLIAPLAPGSYDILARTPEGESLSRRDLTLAAGESRSLTLARKSGEPFPGKDPGGLARAFLRGRVLNTRGHPVRTFHLELEFLGEGGASRAFDFMGDQFALEVPAGRYRLLASLDDGERTERLIDVLPGENPSLEVPVYPGVPLTGRLVDATTREPVAGASVFLSRFGLVVTGQDGRFTLRDLPPGEHLLGIRRGSVEVRHPANLMPGQALDLGELPLAAP